MSCPCDTDDGDIHSTRFQLARLQKKKQLNDAKSNSGQQESDSLPIPHEPAKGVGQFYITDGKIYSCYPHDEGFFTGGSSEYSPKGSKIFREASSQNQQNSSQIGDSTHEASKNDLREDTVGFFTKLTPDSRDPYSPKPGRTPNQYYTTDDNPDESQYESDAPITHPDPKSHHHHHHHHHHMHYPPSSNFNPDSADPKNFNNTESEYEFHATPKRQSHLSPKNAHKTSPQVLSTQRSQPLTSQYSSTPDVQIETHYKSNFDSVYETLMENINSLKKDIHIGTQKDLDWQKSHGGFGSGHGDGGFGVSDRYFNTQSKENDVDEYKEGLRGTGRFSSWDMVEGERGERGYRKGKGKHIKFELGDYERRGNGGKSEGEPRKDKFGDSDWSVDNGPKGSANGNAKGRGRVGGGSGDLGKGYSSNEKNKRDLLYNPDDYYVELLGKGDLSNDTDTKRPSPPKYARGQPGSKHNPQYDSFSGSNCPCDYTEESDNGNFHKNNLQTKDGKGAASDYVPTNYTGTPKTDGTPFPDTLYDPKGRPIQEFEFQNPHSTQNLNKLSKRDLNSFNTIKDSEKPEPHPTSGKKSKPPNSPPQKNPNHHHHHLYHDSPESFNAQLSRRDLIHQYSSNSANNTLNDQELYYSNPTNDPQNSDLGNPNYLQVPANENQKKSQIYSPNSGKNSRKAKSQYSKSSSGKKNGKFGRNLDT
jgi:hypothetical protein